MPTSTDWFRASKSCGDRHQELLCSCLQIHCLPSCCGLQGLRERRPCSLSKQLVGSTCGPHTSPIGSFLPGRGINLPPGTKVVVHNCSPQVHLPVDAPKSRGLSFKFHRAWYILSCNNKLIISEPKIEQCPHIAEHIFQVRTTGLWSLKGSRHYKGGCGCD